MFEISDLNKSYTKAYVDKEYPSSYFDGPELIINNYKGGKSVLSSLEFELNHCDYFCISVAFITESGIVALLQTLKELANKGIKGKILTTDYLTFSEPKALRKLQSLPNIELKMYMCNGKEGFHTKGYIFRNDETYRIIVGSANLTADALRINREWNTKIVGTSNGEVISDVLNDFEDLWNDENTLAFEDFIDTYSTKYEIQKRQRELALKSNPVNLEQYNLTPNDMQVKVVQNFRKLIAQGKDRGLLISATGTGKTYASAFAMRDYNPQRLLFIVHREKIARQALDSYEKVFGKTRTYALLSGSTSSNLDEIKKADFIFATIQTISKDNVLYSFSKDEFSAITLDEIHHGGSNSFTKLMGYFTPKFYFGMTASPDTNRYDIYKLFDHNIIYEIRLQKALEEDLLCPFHYFGITDIYLDNNKDEDIDFNDLVLDKRVNYIIEQARYYGYSGKRVKGLIFCSRKEEAKELSIKFNEQGLKTIALSGEDSDVKREEAINKLTNDETDDYLDYIFSVDIFSEGVDIPEINQIIMLRPTQSAIVFVQQLGRGLRKYPNKEFVVILDFIANYANNFLIPIALSGDRTYNKDNVRRYLREGEKMIPGISTIHFDEISKKRIYQAIDEANFSDISLLKENYTNLKYKLGRIPTLFDFDDYGEMDILRIFDNKSLGSYYKFLMKYEKDYDIRLNKIQEKIIEFISKKLANGKRVYELIALKQTIDTKKDILKNTEEILKKDYHLKFDDLHKTSVINILTNSFPTGSNKDTYKEAIFIVRDTLDYKISNEFAYELNDNNFKQMINELIEFGISRYLRDYKNTYNNTDFVLYEKYTYEDVCHLLNWEKNIVSLNIGGYKYDEKTHTFPVFINYEKEEDITDTTKYEDRFINRNKLISISKSGRTINSNDVQYFLNAKKLGIDVHLFIRKNKDDDTSKEFYYFGTMEASGKYTEFVMPNTNKNAVEIEWNLDTSVKNDIYEYIVGE